MSKIATKEFIRLQSCFVTCLLFRPRWVQMQGERWIQLSRAFLYLITKIRCRSQAYILLTPKLILTFTTNSEVRDNTFSFFIGNFSKVIYRWNSIVTNLGENNAYDKRNRKYCINCDCPFHRHPLKTLHYERHSIKYIPGKACLIFFFF